MRNPRGDPIKGTICAIMGFIGLVYGVWMLLSPLNLLFVSYLGVFPGLTGFLLNTILFIPFGYLLVRKWLQTMQKRTSGPAAGIDVLEPVGGVPESGDEWGRATRPYTKKAAPQILGSKSEIREAPLGIDDGFFVKMPDLDTGEALFDADELRSRAMTRSKVSSGGWIRKRASSRGSGSLKSSETEKHGRPRRSKTPRGEVGSIDIPATVVAAVSRMGKKKGAPLEIKAEDIREKSFTGRIPLTVILVIDVSMSMKGSMIQVRRLVERMEREIRGSRDRVGIIAFKDSGAVEVQAPTTNWNKVYGALSRLRISGLTPLAEGLMRAMETIKRERMRNPDIEPLVVIISDFSPNIPLAQSVGPGHARYTPVRDLVKAARLARKENIRLAAVNADVNQKNWVKFLKRRYHDALELATLLRMRKEGYKDPVATILAVPEFRKTFGAYLIARIAGGRCYLSQEVLAMDSVIGEFLEGSTRRTRISEQDLKQVDAYLPE